MASAKARPILALAALVAALAVVGGATARAPAATAVKTQTVRVTMSEFKFVLSPTTARVGTVVFRVTNRGKLPHDFKINGRKIPVIGAGKSASVTVRFTKARGYSFVCTVPGHVEGGMFGSLTIKK